MPRGSRVVVNRAKVDAIVLAAADGMFEVGKRMVFEADVPDATPLGLGLIQGGGVIEYVDGKKVGDTLIGGRAIKKPRAATTPKGAVVIIGGYGFPGGFVHNGSIHNAPNPFLARSVNEHVSVADEIIADVARPKVAAIP